MSDPNRRFAYYIVAAILFFCGILAATKNNLASNAFSVSQETTAVFSKKMVPETNSEVAGFIKNSDYREPIVAARGAIVTYVNERNNVYQVLFEKNSTKELPIASLTKLMTALVAIDNYPIDRRIIISKTAADQEMGVGKLGFGDEFSVKDLLYSMLIESNNNAAYALAEQGEIDTFVQEMNNRAKNIGLISTKFFNPTGLDPDDNKAFFNYSTAQDISLLTKNLLKKPLIWDILSSPQISLYSSGNKLHHEIFSTNEFIVKKQNDWSFRIIGGKTGWTPLANGCLVIVINEENGDGKFIAVILGADDRFGEMEKLINQTIGNYRK